MAVITSSSNATIKRIRDLRTRKGREAAGSFFAEGIRAAREALDLAADVELCIVAPDLLTSSIAVSVAEGLQQRGASRIDVSADVFKSLSSRDGPQGIALVVRQSWTPLGSIIPGDELCRVVLDAAQDPGNIGSILRTCDAVGASGIILVGDAADPHDPGAVRGSMGAIFSQQCTRTTWSGLAEWKRLHGVACVGTSDSASLDYRAMRYPHPLVLVMGNERTGLHAEGRAVCDEMVCIPMRGHSDSLNLAVATGVVLYEVLYQNMGGTVIQ